MERRALRFVDGEDLGWPEHAAELPESGEDLPADEALEPETELEEYPETRDDNDEALEQDDDEASGDENEVSPSDDPPAEGLEGVRIFSQAVKDPSEFLVKQLKTQLSPK